MPGKSDRKVLCQYLAELAVCRGEQRRKWGDVWHDDVRSELVSGLRAYDYTEKIRVGKCGANISPRQTVSCASGALRYIKGPG